MDLAAATLADIGRELERGTLTSVELVAAYHQRIDAIDRSGPALRAVQALDPTAVDQAAAADLARRHGRRGPLLGIPVLVKDNIDVAGLPTTAGSLALTEWRRPADAGAVSRLRSAGAVVLGKTNMTEWANLMAEAMPAGYSAAGGQVRNPYDPDISPGGSSSGSAVGVAVGLAPVALGTDTIGSILSPAIRCSVVGMRPTVGSVDGRGLVPLARSYDVVGPLATTVADAGTVLAALRGEPGPLLLAAGALRGARLGVAGTPVREGAERLWENVTATLAGLGATLVPVSFAARPPGYQVLLYEFRRDVDLYLRRLPPEAPVHSLAEVVAFNEGHRAEELLYGQSLLYRCLRLDPNDPATRARYVAARLADGVFARDRFDAVTAGAQLEAVVFPAAGASEVAARAGYPCVSVPAGYYTDRGHPFGVTLVGPAGTDSRLLNLALDLEQALGRAMHRRSRAPQPD